MATIRILYYSKSGHTRTLAEIIKDILDPMLPEGNDAELVSTDALEFDRLKDSAAFIFGTPDYFSGIAGYLKIFFDEWWNDRGPFKNRPAFGFVTHGGGGKATKALENICEYFKMNYIKPTISTSKPADDKLKAQIKVNCEKLVKLLG
ncbi:MAG TPA: NAD(P)H-dependent oxidoreductase [Candidatus Lokiarchaeia archaeon]|nr:NAD(P)H-dependent oxidoreductase [Candidatus Lokiarchaeia archaeon]